MDQFMRAFVYFPTPTTLECLKRGKRGEGEESMSKRSTRFSLGGENELAYAGWDGRPRLARPSLRCERGQATPLTQSSSGQYPPVLACHKILSRSFVNSTMACEHACGSTTRCPRGGLLWNRTLSRVRDRAPPVQNIYRGGYKRDLDAFQGGQRHHMNALVHLR